MRTRRKSTTAEKNKIAKIELSRNGGFHPLLLLKFQPRELEEVNSEQTPCKRAHGDVTYSYLSVGRVDVGCCSILSRELAAPIILSESDGLSLLFPWGGNRLRHSSWSHEAINKAVCVCVCVNKHRKKTVRSESTDKRRAASPCARPRSALCNPSPHARRTPLLTRSQSRALLGTRTTSETER